MLQQEKTTEQLLHQLQDCSSPMAFLQENRGELLECSWQEYLQDYLIKKGMKKAEAVKSSGLNSIYAYQILAGGKNPQRDKLICLAFGLKMTVKEADTLLRLAGKSGFYPRVKRDCAIAFALGRGFSVQQADDLLFELEEPTLCEQI